MSKSYEDILKTAYPIPSSYPKMSAANRAAQFSPFTALAGHSDAVSETGRITHRKAKLDPSIKEELNRKLCFLADHTEETPEITVTCFMPNPLKMGGVYFRKTGKLKRVESYSQYILYTDGAMIPFDNIFHIEGQVLEGMDSLFHETEKRSLD